MTISKGVKRVYYGAMVVVGASLIVYGEPPPLWAVGTVLLFGGFFGYMNNRET